MGETETENRTLGKKKTILKVLDEIFDLTLHERLKHFCGRILKTCTK
jgi:hypothetical protein